MISDRIGKDRQGGGRGGKRVKGERRRENGGSGTQGQDGRGGKVKWGEPNVKGEGEKGGRVLEPCLWNPMTCLKVRHGPTP